MGMDVSVIVPVYNRPDQLEGLLDSFDKMRGTLPREIIIVDDRSTENVPQVLEKWSRKKHGFQARFIRMNKNGGPAKARNRGIKKSSGDLLAFTDSDCIVEPYWIHHLVKSMKENRKVVGMGGRVLPLGKDIFSKYYTYHRILEPPESRIYLVTANCIYHRKEVVDVGGFVEDIPKPGGEDVGLSFKLYKRGYRFGFCEEAVIFHDYRASMRDFSKTFFNYGVGCRLVTDKYFGNGGVTA